MILKIIEPNAVTLPLHGHFYRTPPRKPEDMGPDYYSRYDGHTLAADCFVDGSTLHFIGPPLLNLRDVVRQAEISMDGAHNHAPVHWDDLDRTSHGQIRIDAPVERGSINMDGYSLDFTVGCSHTEVFMEKNAVITMNKDNCLENIRDWATFFVKEHSVNAVILYDNRSESYSLEDIALVLEAVEDLEIAYVIDWPLKFGPTGFNQQWDSDFGQYTAWEHARWRFLQEANSVMINDMDEFPLAEDGRTLVDFVLNSKEGVFTYPVRNVPPVPRGDLPPHRVRLHTDYSYADSAKGPFAKKVIYQPKRVPSESQVGNHWVSNVNNEYSQQVIARHFNGVHFAWRHSESRYSLPERTFDPDTEFYDERLTRALSNIFPDRYASEDGA